MEICNLRTSNSLDLAFLNIINGHSECHLPWSTFLLLPPPHQNNSHWMLHYCLKAPRSCEWWSWELRTEDKPKWGDHNTLTSIIKNGWPRGDIPHTHRFSIWQSSYRNSNTATITKPNQETPHTKYYANKDLASTHTKCLAKIHAKTNQERNSLSASLHLHAFLPFAWAATCSPNVHSESPTHPIDLLRSESSSIHLRVTTIRKASSQTGGTPTLSISYFNSTKNNLQPTSLTSA